MPFKTLALLALAGGAGSVCRYGLTIWTQRSWGASFPAGTFLVNVLGCLAFGLAWGLLDERADPDGRWRLVILTGFMGGFTTFSSFAYESQALIKTGDSLAALANIIGQNVLGLAGVAAGVALGRGLLGLIR